MQKANNDIREYAKSKGVFLWQIADEYGLQDTNFSKLLRHPLLPSERARIVKIINDLSNENNI